MMEPDFEAAKLRVYEEFGIWKPGRCNESLNRYGGDSIWQCQKGHQFPKPKGRWRGEIHHEHNIPPPELTDAIAWRVLVEGTRWAIRNKVHVEFDVAATDPRRALMLALDKALAGAGQGAHERS